MCKQPGRTSEAMNTVPPSHLSDSIVDTVSRPSFSLHVPAELHRSNGQLVVMLQQKWYSLIRPWIARYQRLYRKYKRLPFQIRSSWTPSILFGLNELHIAISLSSLVHYMAEGWMGIGCIADPIKIAVDRETGTSEIIEGNGMLTGRSERTDAT